MAQNDQPDGTPSWMNLMAHPGVRAVMAALYNHGPATFAALRAYVEIDGHGHLTAAGIQRLAAWRMCRPTSSAGSLDDIAATPQLEMRYELTSYGHEFAQLMEKLQSILSRAPRRQRRSLRRRW